jgi:hypothetical protein
MSPVPMKPTTSAIVPIRRMLLISFSPVYSVYGRKAHPSGARHMPLHGRNQVVGIHAINKPISTTFFPNGIKNYKEMWIFFTS